MVGQGDGVQTVSLGGASATEVPDRQPAERHAAVQPAPGTRPELTPVA